MTRPGYTLELGLKVSLRNSDLRVFPTINGEEGWAREMAQHLRVLPSRGPRFNFQHAHQVVHKHL